MDKFTRSTGVAAPLPIDNVDTDMIIPKQYLKTIKRTGLGAGLFARCATARTARSTRISCSTSPPTAKPPILVAGDNLGRGSSREHAPWALLDFLGVRRVIATSFADIFDSTARRSAPADQGHARGPRQADGRRRARRHATLTVDLETQEYLWSHGGMIKFEVDVFRKHLPNRGPRRRRPDDGGSAGDRGLRKRSAAARPWLLRPGAAVAASRPPLADC